ncbi:SsrA-binding protein SmpB [soil metagenome]
MVFIVRTETMYHHGMMSTKNKTNTENAGKRSGQKVIMVNRKAFHDFHIEEQLEAGIQLNGTEIKSIREGKVNIRDAYARVDNGEVWLVGMHISPYGQASEYFNHDPLRVRKLLLRREQIDHLSRQIDTKGFTLVPVRMVLRNGRAKIDIGLARGKQLYDKRQDLAAREANRDIERALRRRD